MKKIGFLLLAVFLTVTIVNVIFEIMIIKGLQNMLFIV